MLWLWFSNAWVWKSTFKHGVGACFSMDIVRVASQEETHVSQHMCVACKVVTSRWSTHHVQAWGDCMLERCQPVWLSNGLGINLNSWFCFLTSWSSKPFMWAWLCLCHYGLVLIVGSIPDVVLFVFVFPLICRIRVLVVKFLWLDMLPLAKGDWW